MSKEVHKIFIVGESNETAITPPQQVFVNPGFVFMLTPGGHIASNATEFGKLLHLLKVIGETDFYLLENIGATCTERKTPHQANIPLDKDFIFFDNLVKSFEPAPFALVSSEWFVFGRSPDWGIYMCEYPTINIIGCKKEFAEKFADVFNISGNGFDELENLLRRNIVINPIC